VVNYKGLKVGQLTELRKRLSKNRRADPRGEELGVPHRGQRGRVGDLNGALGGQLQWLPAARHFGGGKVVKTYGKELDRLKVHFGYLKPAPRPSGGHDAGGFALAGRAARQTAWPVQRPAAKLSGF